MSKNTAIIDKADIVVSDLANNGGLLSVDQSSNFMQKLMIQPTLLQAARFVRMNSPSMKVNKIQFADRIMMPATQGVALDANTSPTNRRSKATTSQVQLNTKEFIAEIRLPYDVIEDNIERGNIGTMEGGSGDASGGIRDTIMTLIAERAAIDLEELGLQGNTASADDYLAELDGFLAKATSHVVDFAGATISKDLFKQGLQAMPEQYLRNLPAMRNYLSTPKEIAYRDYLADRQTGLGDAQIQGTGVVHGFGVPIVRTALMPVAQGLFTNPLNLLFGMQREIHVETDKDIRAREYIIVLTTRVDFAVEEEDALVKFINIG